MNRIAVRLSIGLLGAAAVLIVAVLVVARAYVSPVASDRALQARVLEASRLPAERRDEALREIARVYDTPVEIVSAREAHAARGAAPALTRPAGGVGAGTPLGRPRPFEPDSLFVRIAETGQMIRVGPMRPSPWPLVALVLGVVVFVTLAGIVLARPLVRRLTGLQDTATRIARGELEARADARGDDAISEYAARFNQMAERNQALLEGQRDLMRGVSHELRTPVARIRFALELAREAPAGPERERHLTAIDSDLSEIDELIQELLLVDRLNAGAVPVPSRAFDAAAVVQSELERERSSRPGIEASLRCESDAASLVLDGHERLFRRVVRNLASNARKHARQRIAISVRRAGDALVMTFDDDGAGIPEAARGRILEPFVRLDESRSRQLGGVGLGLTIVDRIVRAVGGSLQIGDAELGGARVVVAWPRGRASDPA